MTSIPRQLLWESQQRAKRLSRKISEKLPPRVSDYIVHGFERIDTLEELDLSVESWRKQEVEVDATLIEEASSIQIAPSGPLPKESHSWNDLYVRTLENVTLDVDSGLVFTRDRVIAQSAGGTRSARDSAFISGAAARYRLKSALETDYSIAPMGDTWHHYHFLVETLPRILHIRAIHPDVQFVSSQPLSTAASQCLKLLDIHVIKLENNALVIPSQVIICDSPTKFWPRTSDVLSVRHALLSKVSQDTSETNRVSYISRLNSDRSPLGESDLERELSKVGARVLHLEKLSIRDQIGALQKTSIAIGPHGAGLCAIMFMAPGHRLIEMSSGDRFESCYRRIAALLDIDYTFIQLEGDSISPNGTLTPVKISQILKSTI